MKTKRGLSAVVTTLMIILLVLIAVGIVWVVIKNIITESSEEIDLSKFTLDMKIEKATVDEDNLNVIIKRNPGQGNLIGIKFILTDATNNEVLEETFESFEELETKSFTLTPNELNPDSITEVSIALILKLESGKESSTDVVDSYKIKEEKVQEEPQEPFDFTGNVLYMKMDNNWQDFSGNENHGTASGDATFTTDAKVGSYAGSFDGSGDRIDVNNFDASTGSATTLSIWAKVTNDYACEGDSAVFFYGEGTSGKNSMYLRGRNCDIILFKGDGNEVRRAIEYELSNLELNPYIWHHYLGLSNNSGLFLYIDGDFITSKTSDWAGVSINGNLDVGHDPGHMQRYMNGALDEFLIFNRELNTSEIQRLYHLNY